MVAYIKNHIRIIYRLNFEEFIIFRRIRLIKYQQMKKSNQPPKQTNKPKPNTTFYQTWFWEDIRYWFRNPPREYWHRRDGRLFKLLNIILKKNNLVLFNIGHWKCNKTPHFQRIWNMDITISFKNATCFAKDRWYIKGRVIHVTVSNDFFLCRAFTSVYIISIAS